MENQYLLMRAKIELNCVLTFISLTWTLSKGKMIDETSSVTSFKKIPTVHEKSNICPQVSACSGEGGGYLFTILSDDGNWLILGG